MRQYEVSLGHRPTYSSRLCLYNLVRDVETNEIIKTCDHTHSSHKAAAKCAMQLVKEIIK